MGTPLHIAALSGHVEAVKNILLHGGSTSIQDAAGAIPLHRAAIAGSAGAVHALVSAAPRTVNTPFSRTAGTALHSAAYLGHVSVLEALMDAGASPCLRNRDGELPIDMYIAEDHDQVAIEAEETPVVDEAARKRVIDILRSGTVGCGADL